MIRRLICWVTLGHDPLFSATPTGIGGWWAYPCRKCGTLVLSSFWAGAEPPSADGPEPPVA